MKILMSGGTGFIGRPLVLRLLEEGHELVVLSRDPAAARASAPPGVEVALTSAAAPIPDERIPWAECFVHLAAEPLAGRWTRARKQRIVHSRTAATQALADALRDAPNLRAFVNASGVGFYGSRSEGHLDESAARGEGFIAEVTAAREEAAERVRVPGRRVVQARIGIVLHSEGGYLQQLAKLRRMGLSGRLGTGAQGVSWTHRDDVVGLLAAAVQDPRLDGPLNVCAPNPTSNGELIRAVQEATGGRGLALTEWMTRVLLGELGQTLLGGQRVMPARALEIGYRFEHPELRSALQALFRPPGTGPGGGSA